MNDVQIVWRDMGADLAFAGYDLAQDDSLKTAVIVSLFTDRRAEADDRLPGAPDDRRGWWGDGFLEVAGDRIGSRLWLLHREKQLASVVVRAREYAIEALQWLVDDGIAAAVDVTAEIVRQGVLGLQIRIVRPDRARVDYRFDNVWGA
jgi:phage gp46-like protein